jgi:integrase
MERGLWRNTSEAESLTLAECLDRYRDEVVPTKKGGRRELDIVNQWKGRMISRQFMSSVRGKDVAQAMKEMEAEGKGPNTIRLHLALLSHLFNMARKEWGMETVDNPVGFVRKPKLPQGRDRRLVGDEETRLLAACQTANPELTDIVMLAIETAMRQGEILGMTWDNVDVKCCTVTLKTTKNGEKRIVPLSSTALRVLGKRPRKIKGNVWGYRAGGLKYAFSAACKKANIDDLHFHDLRHEATSRLFEKGLGLMQVAAITGHKNMQMLKRYTHLKAEDLAKLLG